MRVYIYIFICLLVCVYSMYTYIYIYEDIWGCAEFKAFWGCRLEGLNILWFVVLGEVSEKTCQYLESHTRRKGVGIRVLV